MKFTSKIAVAALAGAIGLSSAGCLRDNTENCPAPGFGPAQGKAIVFGASVGTRAFPGHPIENSANNIPVGTSFGVYAYHQPQGQTDAVPFAELQNAGVTRQTDNTYTYDPVAMWPLDPADRLGFWAYFPWVDASVPDHPMTVATGSAEQSMSITYSVPANASEQVDVMYARSGMKTGYETVSLNFRHALTRIRFEGKLKGFATGVTAKITAVTMRGSATGGELVLLDPTDQATPWWELDDTTVDVAATTADGLRDISLTTSIQNLTAAHGDLLLLPQEVDGIEMVVSVSFGSGTQTYTFPLEGTVDWLMNEIVTYEIIVTPTGIEVSSSSGEWDDAPAQGIIFDGQYKLEVSRTPLMFDVDGGEIDIDITTDYDLTDRGFDAGAFIDFPENFPSWLSVTTDGGEAASAGDGLLTRTVRVSATANDSSGATDRTASFTVRAGNMNYVVNVSQLNEPWLTYRSPGALMDGDVYSVSVSSDFVWRAEIDESTNALPGGGKAIPNLLTPRGAGGDGEEVLFSTYNDLPGILAGSPTHTHKFVTLRFTNPVYGFVKEFPVLVASGDIQPHEANSYMVPNASLDGSSTFGRAILIPVSRANNERLKQTPSLAAESWPRIAGEFDAGFIWTDKPGGMELSSSVSRVKAVGSGGEGYLAVIPGLVEGNALAAATVNNEIKWSWHIWVTDEKEVIEAGAGTDNRWMDRNLGALINHYDANRESSDISGFLYQFGRKEPLQSLQTGNRTPIELFNTDGNVIDSPIIISDKQTYSESINSPTTFCMGDGSSNRNWTTENEGFHLWNDTQIAQPANATVPYGKSIFDPCPWGWKVPVVEAWTDDDWVSTDGGFSSADNGGFYRKGGSFEQSYTMGRGGYWSSKLYSNDHARPMLVGTTPNFSMMFVRTTAFSIRCVRHTEE